MAERRMFAKTIIDSDAFLDMPTSTQALYFHLGMRADDDGFINNPKKIQRIIGASDDDIRILIGKRFIIPFESGVVVIKHWKIHNYIQGDRYKPTVYREEKEKLDVKTNKSYTLPESVEIPTMYPECIQNGDTGKVSIGKVSIGKVSIGKRESKGFTPPSIEQIKDYCMERMNTVDAERFFNFYESKGWMVGKNRMKDWKAAVRSWESREKENKPSGNPFKDMLLEEMRNDKTRSDCFNGNSQDGLPRVLPYPE
jgi:hypothetical protein